MARTDRGAAAVEFALIAPVLVALLLGVIEFGNWFNQQITLSQAAREGARAYALHHSGAGFDLNAVVAAASPGVSGVTAATNQTGNACPFDQSVVVTTTKSFTSLTGAFGFLPSTMTGKAAMRCGG